LAGRNFCLDVFVVAHFGTKEKEATDTLVAEVRNNGTVAPFLRGATRE